MKTFALAFALVLAAGSAAGQKTYDDPRFPKTPEEKEFSARVVREIHRLVPRNKETFTLGLADRGTEVVFPGPAMNEFERVHCERREAFRFYGFANEVGGIIVAECADGERIRALAAKARIPEEIAKLSTASPEELRKYGWDIRHEKLDDGADYFQYPLIGVGHGILVVHSAVYFSPKTRRAWVIQLSDYPMCHNYGDDYKTFPLCSDKSGFLKALARALAK